MSLVPPALARRLDRAARAAHRFHRFAHHPLCDRYEGEVIRLGRKTRVCRGCAYVGAGLALGAAAGLAAAPGAAPVGAVVLATTLVGLAKAKVAGRFVAALGLGFAVGGGLAWAAAAAGLIGARVLLYRRRGPDRTPCETCPERELGSRCRGFSEVFRRERAFVRFSGRLLATCRPPSLPRAELPRALRSSSG
jgi:hypothetical protein